MIVPALARGLQANKGAVVHEERARDEDRHLVQL